MLVLMFDVRFKTMLLVTMYVGCEIIIVVIVEYDKKISLPLLMEANKLLMPKNVETTHNIHSQVDFESLFHTTTTITYTYKDMSRELVGFHWFPIDVESYNYVLSWWLKEKHKFPTIILNILTSQIEIKPIFSIAIIFMALYRCHL
jgi:hypothetical protein